MQIERRQRRRRLACVLRVCVCACVPQCASGALRCSNARQGGASDEKQRRCAAAAAPSWREGACVMLMKAVRKPCSTLSKPVKPKSSVTCLARTSAHAHGRTHAHAHARTHARTYPPEFDLLVPLFLARLLLPPFPFPPLSRLALPPSHNALVVCMEFTRCVTLCVRAHTCVSVRACALLPLPCPSSAPASCQPT